MGGELLINYKPMFGGMNKKSFYVKIKNDFYLSFFENKSGYEEKSVNGFWLVKHWDGAKKDWRVDLYSDESYKKFKVGQAKYKGKVDEANYIDEHWHSLGKVIK